MNKKLVAAMVTFAFTSAVNAEVVTVKCHVQLFGGGESIHQHTYEQNEAAPIPIEAIGQQLLGLSIYHDMKKQRIYKIEQCVYEQQEFNSKRARNLEETQTK